MKKILLLLIITAGVFVCNKVNAQLTGIAINDDGSKADTSAILDLNVNTTTPKRGFLLPRMTTTQRDAIYQPAKALLIYCIDVDSLEINIGTPASPHWMALTIGTAATGWLTTGNSGTNSGANFLGTTDNASLSLRTNGVERMVVDSIGHVAIGSTAYGAYDPKFLVDYGNTTSNTVAFLKGSIDSYLQINLSNKNSGANASTDYIATADNGTDSTFYIDMGINSSNYSPSVENFGGPNDGYLYTYARNLLIGTGKASTDIIFLLGGGVTKTNTALRIAAPSGNIIVGTGESSNGPVGNILRGPNGKGTNIVGGNLTIQGGSATGTATGGSVNITGGSSVSGTAGAVNINAGSNFPTNINTGISTSDVTIGGNNNNILLPKFTTVGNLIYTASNTGQIGSTTQLTWDNTNGRLGIGTNSPAEKLHVAGNIRMVDGNQGAGKVMISDANGTATWATPASLGVTNSLSLSLNTLTSTVNGVPATSKVICCLSNAISGNTLTTTVNGVTGAGVNIINSNALSLSGNNLTSTVNGISSATLDLSPVISQNAWNLTGNLGTTPGTNFLGTTDATALILKTNSSERMRILSGGNIGIGTTTPGSALDIKGALRLSGSTSGFVGFQPASAAGSTTYTLPATDGTAGQQLTTNGAGVLSWANQTGTTTNTLSLSLNTLTSTVNGISATSKTICCLSNTSTGNTLTTTVNGVTGAGVNIINSNALSVNGTNLISTVNGVASSSLDLSPVLAATAWNLTGNAGTTSGTNFIGTTDAEDFVTKTNNAERMRVTSTGDVVIGGGDNSSTPTDGIVRGPGAIGGNRTGVDLTIEAGNGTGKGGSGNIIFKTAGPGSPGNVATTFTERMRIDNAGEVGIGTTTPGSELDVKGTIRLSGSTSGFVGFQPAAVAGSTTYTLPAADGAAGQQLTTNGAGVLSWSNSASTTTHSLSLSGNTLTSIVNGISATSNAVSGVSNTSSTNTLTTTVNGVTGAGVKIINSNVLSLSGTKITSTINGVASNALDIGSTLTGNFWNLAGNSGTSAATNFVGTTDGNALVFKVNNIQAGYLGLSGSSYATSLGVGASGSSTAFQSTAIGAGADASSGNQATAIGYNSTAASFQGVAIGANANASTSNNTIAIGTSADATSTQGIALGYSAQATTSNQTIAIGSSATASGYQGIAIGAGSIASTNNDALALGVNTTATGYQSTSLGYSADATAQNSTAIGANTQATQTNTIILGDGTNNSSNVGISTNNPAAKLDVNGTWSLGTRSTVNKNIISFASTVGSTTVTAGVGGGIILFGTTIFTAGKTDVDITIPAATRPTSTQATVQVSPAFDLPDAVSIASARLTSTSTVRIRFTNASTFSQLLSGTFYITITEF